MEVSSLKLGIKNGIGTYLSISIILLGRELKQHRLVTPVIQLPLDCTSSKYLLLDFSLVIAAPFAPQPDHYKLHTDSVVFSQQSLGS